MPALDGFFDRPITKAPLSSGGIDLPVLYRDATVAIAFFRVDHRRASDVLSDAPVMPVRFAGGAAMAAVIVLDVRDCSIAAYREVSMSLAVVPRGVAVPLLPSLQLLRPSARADVGWYVVDMPVTTEIALAAGRELWGFPKFVGSIDIEAGDRIAASVRTHSGDEILALEGRRWPGVSVPALDLVAYTGLRGQLLRTVFETRGPMHTGSGRGLALRVGPADRPMADRLRALGLPGARPLAAQLCRRFEAVLPAGAPVAAAHARAA